MQNMKHKVMLTKLPGVHWTSVFVVFRQTKYSYRSNQSCSKYTSFCLTYTAEHRVNWLNGQLAGKNGRVAIK